jgi:hypothetical protein
VVIGGNIEVSGHVLSLEVAPFHESILTKSWAFCHIYAICMLHFIIKENDIYNMIISLYCFCH